MIDEVRVYNLIKLEDIASVDFPSVNGWRQPSSTILAGEKEESMRILTVPRRTGTGRFHELS
jgi:hypothetical protein